MQRNNIIICYNEKRKKSINNILIFREFLNVIQEDIHFDKDWTIPVFALCDATEDDTKVVLIGTYHDPIWWTPMKISIGGYHTLSYIQADFKKLLTKHLREAYSRRADDVEVTITNTYELCGASHEMIDWKEEMKSEFKGYLKIQTCWNTMTFAPPTRTHSNRLVSNCAAFGINMGFLFISYSLGCRNC